MKADIIGLIKTCQASAATDLHCSNKLHGIFNDCELLAFLPCVFMRFYDMLVGISHMVSVSLSSIFKTNAFKQCI